MLSSRRVPALTSLAILLVVIAVASAWRPLVRPFMYAWTGEEDARQQIKGTIAYLGLQVTRRAPDLAPYTPIKNIPDCPFGVNTFLEQEVEPAKVAQSLDLIDDGERLLSGDDGRVLYAFDIRRDALVDDEKRDRHDRQYDEREYELQGDDVDLGA